MDHNYLRNQSPITPIFSIKLPFPDYDISLFNNGQHALGRQLSSSVNVTPDVSWHCISTRITRCSGALGIRLADQKDISSILAWSSGSPFLLLCLLPPTEKGSLVVLSPKELSPAFVQFSNPIHLPKWHFLAFSLTRTFVRKPNRSGFVLFRLLFFEERTTPTDLLLKQRIPRFIPSKKKSSHLSNFCTFWKMYIPGIIFPKICWHAFPLLCVLARTFLQNSAYQVLLMQGRVRGCFV